MHLRVGPVDVQQPAIQRRLEYPDHRILKDAAVLLLGLLNRVLGAQPLLHVLCSHQHGFNSMKVQRMGHDLDVDRRAVLLQNAASARVGTQPRIRFDTSSSRPGTSFSGRISVIDLERNSCRV